MKRMKKLGVFILALTLMLSCIPAIPVSAAATGLVNNYDTLKATTVAYPTATTNFSAGDTFYTWDLDHNGFAGAGNNAALDGTLQTNFTNDITAVYTTNGMQNLFDVVYTPYNATTGAKATVALKFKSTITATTTLSGTMQLKWGANQTKAVSLYGKVYASKTGQTSANKINGIENSINLARYTTLNGKALTSNQYLGDLTLSPGTEILFELYSFHFNWTNGKPGPTASVTQSQLRNGNITVRSSKRSGSDLLDSIDFYTKNGKTYVRVKFKDELVSVDEKKFDFTISLYHNGSRNKTTEVEVAGILRNPIVYLDANQDYVDLSGGQVAKPSSSYSNVEIYTGNYLTVHARLFSSRKYYAKSNTNYSRDDEEMLFKYPEIVDVYNIKHVNLVANSTTVSFDLDDRYYVYDGDGNYLGTSNNKLPFHTKYYLTTKRINLSTGSGGTSSQPEKPPTEQPSAPVAGSDVSVDSAKAATTQAVNTAKQSGATTATVKLKNAVNISLEALKSMNTTAGTMPVYVWADTTTSTGGVDVRIGFNPYGRTAGMNLSASTISDQAKNTKALFQKWYSGNFAVISFGQKGNFSHSVRVSARVDLTGISTTSLKFFSYDTSTNTYRTITPAYSIDSNGYLVFDTIAADNIVISDRALTLK